MVSQVIEAWRMFVFFALGLVIAWDDMFFRGRRKWAWVQTVEKLLKAGADAATGGAAARDGGGASGPRFAVVTGGNGGLGLHTAENLARAGYSVVVACRSRMRGEAACVDLRKKIGKAGGDLHCLTLDLSDLTTIEPFVRNLTHLVNDDSGSFALLVTNAGVMAPPFSLTKQGWALQMGTNHIGHALLIEECLPLLRRGGSARVVVVSSAEAWKGTYDAEDFALQKDDVAYFEERYHKYVGYANSKLANVVYAEAVAKEEAARGSSVTVNSLHPGCLNTDITRNLGLVASVQFLAKCLVQIQPEEGAAYVTQLCVCPTVAQSTGAWFHMPYPSQSPTSVLSEEEQADIVSSTRSIIAPYRHAREEAGSARAQRL